MDVAVVIRLPAPPMLQRELGDWSDGFDVDGHAGSLHVPSLTGGSELAPPTGMPAAVAAVHDWGQRASAGTGDPSDDVMAVGALGVRLKDVPDDDVDGFIGRVKSHCWGWARRLLAWIEVAHDQDLHLSEAVPWAEELYRDVVVMHSTGAAWQEGRPQGWRLTVMGWDPLDQRSWEIAVGRATRGEEPPLGRRLLREGRHSFLMGRLREATLHLGSALEMALFPEVQRVKAASGEKPLSNEATLGTLVNEATRLGIALPPPLQHSKSGFVPRRNGAVHDAVAPPRDDVQGDLHAITGVVTSLVPL